MDVQRKLSVQDKIEIITKAYDYLVNTLPINNSGIINSLFKVEAITKHFMLEIRNELLETDQVMLLLNSVILRSLRVGLDTPYNGLAKVLKECEDPVAKKLGEGLSDGSIIKQQQPPSVPEKITYSTENALEAVRSMYVELLHNTPIKLLIPKLRASEIVTGSQQEEMGTKPTRAAKMTYLLDEIIIPGIGQIPELYFEKFLSALERCDRIASVLASKLKVKSGIIQLSPQVSSPEEKEVSSDFEKYLKDSVRKGSACYRAKEPWIYAVCRITLPCDSDSTYKNTASGFVGTLTIDKGSKKCTITVLVTNNHVLQRMDQARQAVYEFGYLQNDGGPFIPKSLKGEELISENAIFFTDPESISKLQYLDYTVVEVDENVLKETKFSSTLDGKRYSIYDCKFDLDKHIRFDRATPDHNAVVSIYHHPQGLTLKKSSQTSVRCDYLLLYLCDTEKGSSGSLIVMTADDHDEQRKVIGIHRGYYDFGTVTYNYGSTMSAVVDHIHKKSLTYLTSDILYEKLKLHLKK